MWLQLLYPNELKLEGNDVEPHLDGKHKGLSKIVRVYFTCSVSTRYTPGPHHIGPFRTSPTGLAFVAMPLVYQDPVLLVCTHTLTCT